MVLSPLVFIIRVDNAERKAEEANLRDINLFCLTSGYPTYTWELDQEGRRHYFCKSSERTMVVPLPPSKVAK